MDSEEESIEQEIQRELDRLTEADLESSDNSIVDISQSGSSQSDDVKNEVFPEEFENYIKSLQQQTSALELDLAECDDLLQRSIEITSTRNDEDLMVEVTQHAETLEELKLKILEDLEKDEEDVSSDLEDSEESEDESCMTEINTEGGKAMVLVTEQQLEFRELLTGQRNRLQLQYKKQEDQLTQLIEKERQEEVVFEQEIQRRKQEQKQHIEIEESKILTERKEREKEEEKQKIMIEKQLEEEMIKQQKKIRELEEITQREKVEWENRLKEEELKQERKRENAATRIQSVYKGYCTRKQYKSEIDRKWSEAQERRRQERMKQIEEEQKRLEEEEDRKKQKEDEQKRAEELKRIQEEKKAEEERKKKEELEKKKQEEEERKQKEKEDKLRKEEEKKKKAEEERLRKEEDKKRKEEEKRRLAEEKKQREDDERKQKEEEKRLKKEEEERKKKEEAERKKREEEERIRKLEEEKQQKLEKERQEKEEKKRLKEEQQRKEMEKIRQEEQKKLEKEESELLRQEEKLKEFLSEESIDTNDNKENADNTPIRINSDKKDKISPRKSVRSSVEEVVTHGIKNEHSDFKKVLNNGLSSLMEGLPSHLESKRLGWIKSCIPWSQVSNEPWKLKASTSKRPARRPSSAKKLSLLEENLITTAAKVASLRQVTTVELKDLPGSNMSTLGQCTGLQCLKMTNCNLVAVEGLQQCKQLQYLDLKKNSIEYIDLKGLGNIKFIDLSENMISVIHGLDSCTDVRWLDLSDNKITRLGGLNGLRRLHTLNLARNQLISTSGLGDTPTLQQLDLSHNHLQEVVDINKLCLLQHLNLSANNLLQIPDLHNHVLLQDLLLDNNIITSLDGLLQYWLPLVQKLNLSQNSLENLVSLENLLLLRECDLGNNQVIELDMFLSSMEKNVYLETLKLNGNPAIESIDNIDSFRIRLVNTFSRLHMLDDCTLDSPQYGSPIKPRNSFEALCLHQVQMFKDVHNRFQQDLKSHSNSSNLHELCEIYFKFCDKTHKMAEEHRYSHEYGEVSITVPTAPSTPKSGRPRSARASKVLQDSYMSPKEMFERALQDGGGKSNGSNGLVRGDNVAIVKPVVTAKIVQNILEDDSAIKKITNRRNQAAIKIQSVWRGYTTRRWYQQMLQEQSFDLAVLQELHSAATKIQATWRGYSLRCRLEKALDFAKFEDDEEFGEIDLGEFNFNEDILDDWKPPATPQIPSSHPVLGKPPSGKKTTPPKVPTLPLGDSLQPPPPRKAWRGMDSPLSDIQHNHPRPPSSLVSVTDSHRTIMSKKEEKISEEWGFKDNQTAHLMLQRAKKMKYNAERRKKLRKLDPKQRLLLYRKLEETAHYPHVQPPNRKILPRKEYFQERQKEIDNVEREKRIEKTEKVNRTFEWIHTQVGEHEVSDSSINSNNQGNRIRQHRFGSDGNLPKLDSDLITGKPVRLVSSPIDLQSVDSVSIQGDLGRPRRFSAGSSDSQTRLPPIKGGSAPSSQKREKISWRNPKTNTDIGWGGGKKRVVH